MEIVAIIPARGGSKGVLGKNIRLLAGKPLLAYSVEQAVAAHSVSRVLVSTDDEAIGKVAVEFGAEVVWRSAENSSDTATSESALLETLNKLDADPDLIVFLQCTSPLRQADDIDRAVETLISAEADSLLSVVDSHKFIWRTTSGQAESFNYDFRQRPRRQDRDPEYAENGSIYVFKPHILREHNNRLGGTISLYVMDEASAIDIDTLHDFALAEFLMQQSDN